LRLAPLVAIELVAFLLIIGETYLFFDVIVPLGPVPHGLTDYTVIGLVKVLLTFGLGGLWLVVMLALTELYVRSRVVRPTPSA
jgi:hypothetical protein